MSAKRKNNPNQPELPIGEAEALMRERKVHRFPVMDKKGNLVGIEARMNPDTNGNPRVWQKQDGTSGSSFEVNAQTVRFLTTRGESEGGGAAPDAGDMATAPAEDDIPF